jgi:hypothetical protein
MRIQIKKKMQTKRIQIKMKMIQRQMKRMQTTRR